MIVYKFGEGMRLFIALISLVCLYPYSAMAGGGQSFLSGMMQGMTQAKQRQQANSDYEACVQAYGAAYCSRAEAELQQRQLMEEQRQEIERLKQERDDLQSLCCYGDKY